MRAQNPGYIASYHAKKDGPASSNQSSLERHIQRGSYKYANDPDVDPGTSNSRYPDRVRYMTSDASFNERPS